ncbi:MAG: hypothetical protein MUF62_02940 [Chitinophagaceae bacterium]|nr:hypothetical protein [Chitinophagaceae bacterium]
MKRLLVLLMIVAPGLLLAQQPVRIEMGTVMNAAGQPVSDGAMVYGAESLKKNVTYNDVKGSPFFNDTFRISLLYDANNKLIGRALSRINFFNNQLHYRDQAGNELTLAPDAIRKVQYVDRFNESIVLEEYVSDITAINQKQGKPVYVQVLNSGDTRLLRFQSKYLSTYDSLMGQFKRYMFARRVDYYLQRQQSVEPLRKFSKERILAFTRQEEALTALATREKLDFKKEEDVARLLQLFYNKPAQ